MSGKECALYGSYSASTPGNADTEAEKIVWFSSDPSIIDITEPIVDFYIADAENNHVSIQKSFTAKKAGTVVITATAPDGRSESVTVDVEPKLVAVGTDKMVTKETEIPVFQMTLNESDAEYLERIISKVQVELSAPNEVAVIKEQYYKIAEDGLSAEIIIVLEGDGTIESSVNSVDLKIGKTVLVPASLGDYTIKSSKGMKFLRVTI